MRAQKIFSTQNTTWKIVYQGVYTLPGFLPAYRPHPKKKFLTLPNSSVQTTQSNPIQLATKIFTKEFLWALDHQNYVCIAGQGRGNQKGKIESVRN